MRILVGTLYSIENEFEECLEGIRQQTYRDFEHFVIQGLPKREAHDALYGTFMTRANEFGLFMKVDADMVITNRDLFARIVDTFRQSPNTDVFTIEVYDFFTNRLIDGMHTFRSTVRWQKRENAIFTDRHSIPPERQLYDFARVGTSGYSLQKSFFVSIVPLWFTSRVKNQRVFAVSKSVA